EYACRAGTDSAYFSGEDLASLEGFANVFDQATVGHAPQTNRNIAAFDDGYVTTSPVGNYQPNAFGLHDTHGNAFELCRDVPVAYRDFPPRRGDGLRGPASPTGAVRAMRRGGSYFDDNVMLRSSARHDVEVDQQATINGFRPVLGL
ncbi:MAG: SUMF1/EgtB/PvdO family nonheme iron enzyme, partial [Pseudomonadales bacterium]|nr:SUMF1/EgtB/PvdO family nonheme iron enzyme [Pseudomonadales bacterium]